MDAARRTPREAAPDALSGASLGNEGPKGQRVCTRKDRI